MPAHLAARPASPVGWARRVRSQAPVFLLGLAATVLLLVAVSMPSDAQPDGPAVRRLEQRLPVAGGGSFAYSDPVLTLDMDVNNYSHADKTQFAFFGMFAFVSSGALFSAAVLVDEKDKFIKAAPASIMCVFATVMLACYLPVKAPALAPAAAPPMPVAARDCSPNSTDCLANGTITCASCCTAAVAALGEHTCLGCWKDQCNLTAPLCTGGGGGSGAGSTWPTPPAPGLCASTCNTLAARFVRQSCDDAQLIGYYNDMAQFISFAGVLLAFLAIHALYALGKSASLPPANSKVGATLFAFVAVPTALQLGLGCAALVYFFSAFGAATSWDDSVQRCLQSHGTGYSAAWVVAFFAAGYHPIYRVLVTGILFHVEQLTEAARVWHTTRGNGDLDEKWTNVEELEGMQWWCFLFFHAWPLFCFGVGMLAGVWLFSFWFFPIMFFQCGFMALVSIGLQKLHNGIGPEHKNPALSFFYDCTCVTVCKPNLKIGTRTLSEEQATGMQVFHLFGMHFLLMMMPLMFFGGMFAFYCYAGHSPGEVFGLVREIYEFSYSSFTTPAADYSAPLFVSSWAEMAAVLQEAWGGGVEGGLGAHQLLRCSRALFTLSLCVGLVRPLFSWLSSALARVDLFSALVPYNRYRTTCPRKTCNFVPDLDCTGMSRRGTSRSGTSSR